MPTASPVAAAGIWSLKGPCLWNQVFLDFNSHLPSGQGCTNWHPNHRLKSADCRCWGAVLEVVFHGAFLVTC